jgi:hypothetical protein
MSFDVNYFTLQPVDATNRFVTLDGTPVSSNNVALDIIGGTAQALPSDFTVSGATVRWDFTSSNLNGLLAAQDQLRVIFDKS